MTHAEQIKSTGWKGRRGMEFCSSEGEIRDKGKGLLGGADRGGGRGGLIRAR